MGKRTSPITDRNRDTYGDSTYKGNGKILCYICDQPVRDHPQIGPCPYPYTDNPRRPPTRAIKT